MAPRTQGGERRGVGLAIALLVNLKFTARESVKQKKPSALAHRQCYVGAGAGLVAWLLFPLFIARPMPPSYITSNGACNGTAAKANAPKPRYRYRPRPRYGPDKTPV